jgi:HEAT repeat protein
MKLTNGISIHSFALYGLVLILVLGCIGCSKTDKEEENKAAPVKTTAKEQTQLSSEDAEQLKKENENAKKAIAKVLAVMDEEESLSEKNKELKQAVSKLIDVNEQTEKYQQEKARTEALIAEFESATNSKEKIDFLQSLNELSSAQDLSVINVIRRALKDPDLEVGRAAIELLDNYNSPEIIPAVEDAMGIVDDEIRMDALSALSGINNEEACELLIQGLGDNSKDVRATALNVASEQSDQIALSVLEKGIVSPYNDVKYNTAYMLQDRSDHRGLEVLFVGLKDSNPQFREEINEILNFLVNKEFESYDEATTWWNENKSNYDEELFEKENI